MSKILKESNTPLFLLTSPYCYTQQVCFSQFLKETMASQHKSIRSLAAETHLSPSIIHRLRKGEQDDLKLSTFSKLILALDYHPCIIPDEALLLSLLEQKVASYQAVH